MAIRCEQDSETERDRAEEEEARKRWERHEPCADAHDRGDADQEGRGAEEHQLDEPWVFRAWPQSHAQHHHGCAAHRDVGRDHHVHVHELGTLPHDEVGCGETDCKEDHADEEWETVVHLDSSKDSLREPHGGIANT